MYAVYGIIGDPVDHSLSPIMHNAAFKELGIKAVYGAFEVKTRSLEDAITGIRALNIKGVSVTIPHKEEVMKHLDEVKQEAVEIGAVNTIVNEAGKLTGYNTDWIGVVKAFELNGVNLKGKKVVIIGAGGAAKAVVYAVKRAGASEVEVYNRTIEKAKALERAFGVKAKPLNEVNTAAGEVIIQTTSVGLNSSESPVSKEVLKNFKVAMDIVYSPLKTQFLKFAEECGCKIIDGLQMLLYQGVEQFKLWTGENPPIEVMKKVLYETVRG